MTGVDVHVDTNIGKHLSSLGHTLTTLTGEYEEEGTTTAEDGSSASDDLDDLLDLSSSDDLNVLKRQKTQQIDLDLPPFLFDPNLDKAVVAKYLEHEINEQAKTLEDLQKLGASDATVNAEMKKLNELQNIASKNFRQARVGICGINPQIRFDSSIQIIRILFFRTSSRRSGGRRARPVSSRRSSASGRAAPSAAEGGAARRLRQRRPPQNWPSPSL